MPRSGRRLGGPARAGFGPACDARSMSAVARLSVAPVRSLGLLHPEAVELTERGVVEDRRFYLIDEAGKLVDRLVSGSLVRVATWTDPDARTLRFDLPDGRRIDGEVDLGEPVETYVHGRIAVGHVVEGPWAAALEGIAGRPVRVVRCDRVGGTRSGHPASLISRGSLRELARNAGVEAVDGRRFRMLIELDGDVAHEEDDWIGARIALGEAILRVTERDARCAITTQDPDTGVRDLDTLRTIISYRGPIPDEHGAPKAMLGVLADVERPGRVRLGDEARVHT
ncbi:MAG: MOSC domain-containing protein [Chloroflexota bacterium]|nr:MAG: MOSC domain-containing protein [Chloroflexota bacterium]